jgi:mono/diheme cytochrome c family protein
MKFLGGVVVGLLLVGLAGAFMVHGGRVPVGATAPPDMLDQWAPTARDKAIARQAPAMQVDKSAEAARRGMEHYGENCMPCHGAPGGKAMEFAQGMNPKPPALDAAHAQDFTDGQLFWVVKNGLRASGMPGFGVNHRDPEIQDIVAFVRRLPRLTPDEKKELSGAGAAEHHHHDEAAADEHGDHHH